jgi:hypothetical protein
VVEVLCIIKLLSVSAMFLICIFCFIFAIQEKIYPLIIGLIPMFAIGVPSIVICFLNLSSFS